MNEINTTIEEALNQHEKQLLALHEQNIQKTAAGINQLKGEGKFVYPILIHQIREGQTEVNKLYKKYGFNDKYSVPSFDLNEEQKKLNGNDQKMLEINLINLDHAQRESKRLTESGQDDSIAQSVIAEAEKNIRDLESKISA